MVNANEVEIKMRRRCTSKVDLEIGKREASQKEEMESPKKYGDASKSLELSTKYYHELFLHLVKKVN